MAGAGRAGRSVPEDAGCAGTSSAAVKGLMLAEPEPATGEIDMLLSMLRPETSCTAHRTWPSPLVNTSPE